MSSRRDYILNEIKKEREPERIRSFFYDMTTDLEFRNPDESIKQEIVPLTPDDEAAFVYLEPPAYGNTLMIDPSKDVRGILRAYYLPRTQPHLVPFLKAQSAYLHDLQGRWKEALTAYTYHGDRFINGFLRNSLNRYEFVKNTNSENEYAFKKRYTFIDLINSVRSSGICPFKYAIKERYPDLRKTLENLPIMEMHSYQWIEVYGRNFEFPPLSFSMNDDEAFQKIMQSTWFNSIENVRPIVESLLVDLLKIFINSPRVTEDIVVYRGVKTNYYRPGPTTSEDFWSTSISPEVSLSFASYLGKNVHFTVEEITIKKDVPCLFISQYSKVGSGEWEILLPPGVNYFIENDLYLKKMPAIPSNNENSDYESMQNDTSMPETYIKYMMDKRKPKWFVLVNGIRADSFDTEIPIVKKIFAEAEQRKAVLNERRRMRHLGWVPEGRSVTRNRNQNQNRNKSRRRNTQRRKQRNEKWQSSDENN
jgi:hypothetical protein